MITIPSSFKKFKFYQIKFIEKLFKVFGVIYVIDGSDEGRLEEAGDLLRSIISNKDLKGKPILILLNKKDQENCIDEIEFTDRFGLHDLTNIYRINIRIVSFLSLIVYSTLWPIHESKLAHFCRRVIFLSAEVSLANEPLAVSHSSQEICSAIRGTGKFIDPAIKDGFNWLLENIFNDYEKLQCDIENALKLLKQRHDEEKLRRNHRLNQIVSRFVHFIYNSSHQCILLLKPTHNIHRWFDSFHSLFPVQFLFKSSKFSICIYERLKMK